MGALKDVPTHTQCGHREGRAGPAGTAGLERLHWCSHRAAALLLCTESFKVGDKYRFHLDFKNFFSLTYDLTLLTEFGHNFLYFYVST